MMVGDIVNASSYGWSQIRNCTTAWSTLATTKRTVYRVCGAGRPVTRRHRFVYFSHILWR